MSFPSEPDDSQTRPLTEAEYLAWMAWKHEQLAREFTSGIQQLMPGSGLRFEFGSGDGDVLAYDMDIPKWPYSALPWTPFRHLPRPMQCYRLPSGAPVHVKPDCRC